MKRILIATGLYPPDIGGPATYAVMLEEALPACGYTTSVVSFGSVRHYPKVIKHVVYFFKLLRRAKDADIVYALDPVSVGLPAMLVSWVRRRTFLLRLGGDYAWEAKQLSNFSREQPLSFVKNVRRQPLKIRVLAWIERVVARRAVVVIMPSHYLARVVECWGVPKERIKVIYNPVPERESSPAVTVTRASLGISPKDFVIVSAGRLIPLKCFDELIEVMAALHERLPHAKLFICGDGPERAKLEALVIQLGLTQYVTFTGNIPQPELQHYFALADVFVLNSMYETFPHIVLEAVVAGTPVIARDVGGNSELADMQLPGLTLVPPDGTKELQSAIEELADQCEATRVTIDAAYLEQFGRAAVIDDLLRVLQRLS